MQAELQPLLEKRGILNKDDLYAASFSETGVSVCREVVNYGK